MNGINNRVNFCGSQKIIISGKNNPHKKYLFNEVNNFIDGKGITTEFHTGTDKIIMNAETNKIADMIRTGLKKLDIRESLQKK